jgi:hypothetical protein
VPVNRRTLIAVGLASLARPIGAASEPAETSARANARYIMPLPSGDRSGDSWANAASIWQLNEMIARAGPNGTVYVRADAGSYSAEAVRISQGGDAGSPVTVIGVNKALTPMKATIMGNRTAWTLPTDPEMVTNVRGWSVGPDIFLLQRRADHLTFKYFDFQRVGQPFHLRAPTHSGITIIDCSGYNIRRFFEHDPGTSHLDTVLKNIVVTGFSKTAIRIRGASRNVLLEDLTLNSARLDGDNFATGVECNETAHDIIMRRVTVSNCHDTHGADPNRFWNADGFASERGNANIRREDCTSRGNTDAGYDDKGTNVVNVRCVASGNKTNYKCWGPSTTNIDCVARDPRSRGGAGPQMQYYVYGGAAPDVLGADVLIKGGVISDNDPNTTVFLAEVYNSVLRIAAVNISHHAAAAVQRELGGWGNVFLYGSASDTVPPAITSAASVTADPTINFAHELKADKRVTWSVVGGPDAAAFKVAPDRRVGTLMLSAAPGWTKRQIIVCATDAAGNRSDQSITVTSGSAPTVFFSDAFDRADQDLGASGEWTFIREGGGDGRPTDVAIRGGKIAIFSTAFRGAAYASPDCGFSDHYVQAEVASIPNGENGLLACRLADPSNLIGVEFKSDRIGLLERADGEFKELGFVRTSPAVGDVIRVEVKGAEATVKKNGVVIIGPVATGRTDAAGTRTGIVSRGTVVNSWIDNYESGPV